MIRLRLWHTPENIIDHCGNPITSSNLSDIITAAQQIKSYGMELMLAIHYGDYFNDPGKQLRPAAWDGLAHQILLDSIYQYTYNVVEQLHFQDASPDIIGVGNETTWGFVDESVPTNGFTWPEDSEKFNAGFDAIDDLNNEYSLDIKKAIHLTEGTALWATEMFADNGITNYDIIGVSFYPYFSPETSLKEVGQVISQLQNTYQKEVMIFETGFIWTTENGDNYGNFIGNNGSTLNYPLSPQGQKDFLLDLAQVINDNHGTGIFYWEPAWISSNMCDFWGQGSSYENASIFDFNNSNAALPAFDFFEFCDTLSINNTFQGNIKIYPNPGIHGKIKIMSPVQINSWELYTANGQQVSNGQFPDPQSEQNLTIERYNKGLYFLLLTIFDGRTAVKKLIL